MSVSLLYPSFLFARESKASLMSAAVGFLVKILTSGTITNPASIATAPQLIGDCSIFGKWLLKSILASIKAELNRKLDHAAAFVTFFEYSESRYGARNAPASAPHEIPIRSAIKVVFP